MFGTASLGAATFADSPITGGNFAIGSTTTQFGTPIALFAQRGVVPAGFSSTALGGPHFHRRTQPATTLGAATAFGTGFGANYQRPTGFSTTQFGSVRVYPPHAVGWLTTHLGTHAGHQSWTAESLGPITIIPTAYYAAAQSETAAGFARTAFGQPVKIAHAPTVPVPRTCAATSFRLTAFGLAHAAYRQTGIATGFSNALLGTPRVIGLTHAAGLFSTAFGSPTSARRQRVTGFKATSFGTASAVRHQAASSLYRPTRFGLPTAVRSRTYATYGINASGRFGQPAATQRHNHPASGFAGTHFGTPAAHERHRVSSLPPVAVFGEPLLKRNAQC